MLIPAMAFAWCVISVQAERASAARSELTAATKRSGSSRPAALLAAPQVQPDPLGETRVAIRAAIPASVIDFAKTLVTLPMGTEHIEEIDGQRYVFVLERHFHPPGFVGAPTGWHKGVTAYELKGDPTPASKGDEAAASNSEDDDLASKGDEDSAPN